MPFDWFEKVDGFQCGTTNIDFSPKLHRELERMRSYRRTAFHIQPSGLTVTGQGSSEHKEKKIDVPESWVGGFLQVHSTMTLGLTHLRMAPVDLFNLCRFLRGTRRGRRHAPCATNWNRASPSRRCSSPLTTLLNSTRVRFLQAPNR